MISGDSTPQGTTPMEVIMVPICRIEPVRKWKIREIEKAHIEVLIQHRLNTGADFFDPIDLWIDDKNDIYVIDGLHRLLAYRTNDMPKHIPARVLECSEKEALFAASKAHSKPVKSLNGIERQNLAWFLVRTSHGYTAKETSEASGVSMRQVKYMRARWKHFQSERIDPTGYWWRDRSDDAGDDLGNNGFSSMSATDTARAVKAGIKSMKDFINQTGESNPLFKTQEGRAHILIGALGDKQIKQMFNDYFNRDFDPLNLSTLPHVPDEESSSTLGKLDFE